MRKYILLIGLFFLISEELSAGLNVDPVVVEAAVSKKDSLTQVIKIANTGKEPIRVRVEVNKINKADVDVGTWFQITPQELELAPSERKDFSYVIDPPEDSEGELRCMLFFIADEIGEKRSTVGIRFGVPVYGIIKETIKLEAEIDNIAVDYDLEDKLIKGTVYVKNSGNIHIRPYINMDILGKEGNKIGSFEIPFGQPAQAGQLRPFMFTKKIELQPGNYKLMTDIDYGRMYGLKDYIGAKEVGFEVKKDAAEKVK